MRFTTLRQRRLYLNLAFFSSVVVAVLVNFLASTSLAAGIIHDSQGFENPPFNSGNLSGQQGWNEPVVPGSSTAVLQSTVSKAPGSMAVKVDRPANQPTSSGYWAVQQNPFTPQRFIAIDWDMRVEQTGPTAGFGPFFGVTSWGALNGVGSQTAALGVDAANGSVVIQEATTGNILDTGVFASFGQWYHYRIVLDYQSHTYKTFLNNSQLTSTGFVDGNLNQFTDADISTFALGGDSVSQNLGGTSYIDNFVIRDGLVGDYDVDGDVDAADYTRWKATYGTTVSSGTGADGNKNGFVDAADYVMWRNNLGTSLFVVPGSGATINAIPEPSTLATLFLGLLLANGCKRRGCR